ncbi:hypothetical protein G6F57_012926 [Rhizopus arrhizus]|uniref:Uncharacterized protein n=1 Tax=Rhizopus oryzae TaxID=64495 RepID=A0A9P6WWF1_RHIOR|nr:hypothetical protein G6F23_012992 [Rhizopus arrhizus]KAG1407073.1 hypothetical protein G6F58_009724 [Rhizopus delemar]KAG0752904.1 hypothetical protein G6F24_013305 [Rhizopus arrhizus]KAG0776552.1 hypothetical protein G6F22_012490 [Rhizopus arrhizus]KAG0778498.1 hypothetical protein G6F21_012960 [Rhizopus arrhizus]
MILICTSLSQNIKFTTVVRTVLAIATKVMSLNQTNANTLVSVSHLNLAQRAILTRTLLRVNMDTQINADRKVLSYLAKYMSKADSDVHLHYHVETSQEHLKARMIGAVEAVYHICVWYLHM